MNDERSEQESAPKQAEEPVQCGPGCNCGSTGLGTKGKMIICLVVVIAAGAVLARGLTRKAENKAAQGQTAFAAAVSASTPKATPITTAVVSAAIPKTPPITTEKAKAAETNQAKSSLWGEPLKDLASLNQVAAQTNAVFLYLPDKGRGADEAVKRQIEQAAGKAQSGGTKMACFTLDAGSPDYAKVTSQVPAPCVLAMVKGRGMSPVTGEISEGKLLQAIVAASRPSSGCGPSGCGPSSAGCN